MIKFITRKYKPLTVPRPIEERPIDKRSEVKSEKNIEIPAVTKEVLKETEPELKAVAETKVKTPVKPKKNKTTKKTQSNDERADK